MTADDHRRVDPPGGPERTGQEWLTEIERRAQAALDPALDRPLAQVLEEIGPWEGESTAEILEMLAAVRREGAARDVPDL